jgi:hypothetical protein
MLAMRTRSLTVMVAAALCAACGTALLAQAADAQKRHAVARTASSPAAESMSLSAPISRGAPASAPQALQCGWRPANNANAFGYITVAPGYAVNTFNGPDPYCSWAGTVTGKVPVIVHCGWHNYHDNRWYDYFNYAGTSITAWVWDGVVNWRSYGGHAEGC